MADLSQLGRVPEDEDSASGPYNDAAAIHDEPRSQSPATIHTVPRRNSSVSHVSLDFFDPAGVEQLRRTMSHMSAAVHTSDIPDVPVQKIRSHSTVDTTTTLAAPKGDEPFDLERTLRTVMKRYLAPAHLVYSLKLMVSTVIEKRSHIYTHESWELCFRICASSGWALLRTINQRLALYSTHAFFCSRSARLENPLSGTFCPDLKVLYARERCSVSPHLLLLQFVFVILI